jgi:hypothetical protein
LDTRAIGGPDHYRTRAARTRDRAIGTNIAAEQAGQIAVALGLSGYRRDQRSTGAAPRALIIHETENSVLANGRTNGAAELVPAEGRVLKRERISGIRSAVAQELE